jgi:hypothetical protein
MRFGSRVHELSSPLDIRRLERIGDQHDFGSRNLHLVAGAIEKIAITALSHLTDEHAAVLKH